jgi:hypothetical protein
VRFCRYPWPGEQLPPDRLGRTHTLSNGPRGRLLPGLACPSRLQRKAPPSPSSLPR